MELYLAVSMWQFYRQKIMFTYLICTVIIVMVFMIPMEKNSFNILFYQLIKSFYDSIVSIDTKYDLQYTGIKISWKKTNEIALKISLKTNHKLIEIILVT